MRQWVRGTGVFVIAMLGAAPAFATSTGITGNSGKDTATCNTCHKGGEAPSVEFEGPSTLEKGATGQYTLIIRGGAAKTGGAGITVDDAGTSLVAGTGLKKLGSELTHSAPQAFTGTELRFNFSLVAPATDVTLNLFGAGNSTNADQKSDGDRAAATKLTIKVGNGSPVAEQPGDNDDSGGCAAASSAPFWALALAGLPLVVRRRRRS
ncbi:SYNERG-CTERM sorting domain-containing protein [Corallococcus aberystwythensis]|uniref:SYNERG-CTERM sorting domain-containing protein n=1 Tax=Corallococcus aberystwythensis TaxID=2316722 RepID=A0A3A8PY92_9BACT|nr:MXAN_6652 family MXYO-CTERM-anchored protein [Corallococcus aberystwythensis]RKH61429.1 SYNERG-CTERM sorting domain-containing protein [Corallococcus aberystwythensis]